MAWLLTIVKSKVFMWVGGIAFAALAAWGIVSYIESNAVKDLKLKQKLEELLIWERTKDATDTAPDNSDDALDFLRDR